MVDTEQVKKAVVFFLTGMEKVSSFAETISPLCTIITVFMKVLKEGLKDDLAIAEYKKVDEDFSAIHTKLDTISQTNQKLLTEIKLDEVKVTYGKHENYIKLQYTAFIEMVEKIKKNPDDSQKYMEEFKVMDKYELEKGLKVFYRGICEEPGFGRPLLDVYFEHCDGNKTIMETRCSHIINLFNMGLMALMARTAIKGGDKNEVEKKWGRMVKEMKDEMMVWLEKCNRPN
ncbi:protein rapunzel-like [Centroberyx affinis]|uniref:protein rapunzel-like n=1 Tax=Centroberyx affinis TaxID=166261 RepID=UPI003A5C76D8